MLTASKSHGRRITIALLVGLAALSGGCALAEQGRVVSYTSRLAASLTPTELAGQRIIYSYRGLTPPAVLLRAIRSGQAAGVIFFSDNISSVTQISHVAAQLQRVAARSPVKLPLLLMTDQEGGAVRRLPGAPVYSEKQIGAFSDAASAARRAGRGAGLNLQRAGLNVNLSPVLDVFRAPGNFIDEFGRSYSSNPSTVASLGAAFITKQQQVGVAATAKHFPGLGAATVSQNTDERPVTLNLSLSTIRSVDERPYTSAIAAGVKLVMLSWARYPALDAGRPAGLSPAVVQGELRRHLHFGGVTITDSLGAGALAGFGGTAERSVMAAKAGMDLIMCTKQMANQATYSQGAVAVGALAQALRTGGMSRAAFLTSVSRILALRRSLSG